MHKANYYYTMVVSFTKNLLQRIETQNKKGYKIERKPRKKPVLPVNKKPVVIGQVVNDKVPRKEKQPQITYLYLSPLEHLGVNSLA